MLARPLLASIVAVFSSSNVTLSHHSTLHPSSRPAQNAAVASFSLQNEIKTTLLSAVSGAFRLPQHPPQRQQAWSRNAALASFSTRNQADTFLPSTALSGFESPQHAPLPERAYS